MDAAAERALAGGGRCLLAARGPRGPLLAPLAYWYDGAAAWMSTPADGPMVHALGQDSACALWVEPGTLATGQARVFSLRDPLSLAVHAPVLAAAMAALALENVSRLAARLPRSPAILKVTVTAAEQVPEPALPPGIAPALPTVVPPDVRRALAGRRRVVLATAANGRLAVTPSVWGAGFTLAVPDGSADGTAAAVALEGEERLGLTLNGSLSAGPRLAPQRVTWWRGSQTGSADVPLSTTRSAVVLPD